jgi:ATP-binding cassette subfamily B protein
MVNTRSAAKNVLRALRFAFVSHAVATIGMATVTLIGALSPVTQAWVAKHIIDGVSAAMQSGAFRDAGLWAAIQPVLPWLVAELLIVTVSAVSAQLRTLFEHLLNSRMSYSLNTTLMRKALEMDLEYFEDASFYDLLQNARQEADRRVLMILNTSFMIIQNTIQLASFAAVLLLFSPLLTAVIFGASLPLFFVQNRFSSLHFRLLTWRVPETRRMHYYENLVTHRDSIKEIKLFGLGDLLLKRYDETFWKFFGEDMKLAQQRSVASLIFGLLATATFYGAYAWVVWRTVSGGATLGDMALYLSLFQQSQGAFISLLRQITNLYESSLFMSNYYQYLDLKPRMPVARRPRTVKEGPHEIEFRDVSFRYPGMQEWVLRNISLKIWDGEKIALVGQNGAGKTTFIKLLTRLYDPTEGSILLDGVDLREYDPASLRRTIGVIFQDFVRYQASAAENVAFGDVEKIDDRQRILNAIEKGGADDVISEFSEGIDTLLGTWVHSGRELSGGQWQKIALSRAFMRDSAILVLDEPTSALDAAREYEIFQRFRELTAGRIVLLISHRFSTVRMADRIAVIENGELTELGSHAELLARDGVYARLFHMQAEGYR